MKKNLWITSIAAIACCLLSTTAFAHEDGDALQFTCYRATEDNKPDVSDADIAGIGNETDWASASARVVKLVNSSNPADTMPFTVLFANDNDTLYIGMVGYINNASAENRIRIYFDQNNDGSLAGSAGSPGEYFTECYSEQSVFDGGWEGTTDGWQDNADNADGLKGGGHRRGTGTPQLHNWEFQIPLHSDPVAGNARLNVDPGDEIGVFFEITMNTGASYWLAHSNSSPTEPTSGNGWAELQLQGAQVAAREISALLAKGYVPTIDGDISNDIDWQYAFEKTITFTDFEGHKLQNSRLYLKEDQANDNILIGVRVATDPTETNDYLQVYFDQGNEGGSLNYFLNPGGSAQFDDAVRLYGNGNYQDRYFNGTSWKTDGTEHGSGAAGAVAGTAWEFEISRPLSPGGGAQDLDIQTTDSVGLLMRFYDADDERDYWWSATINHDSIKIDPEAGRFSALGWAILATGGPFVQPLYPKQSDIVSGTYPFMLYAEDEDGVDHILSAEYRITDLDDRVIIDYSSATQMTRVSHDTIGLWVGTFNSDQSTIPDGDYNVVFRVTDDDSVRVISPVRIQVQNAGEMGGPTVTVENLATGGTVSADTLITFNVMPSGNYDLVADSIQVSVDGEAWSAVDSTPPLTGGDGQDTLDVSGLSNGAHTLWFRAKDTGDRAWGYSELIIFNLDKKGSNPTVTITSPADSSVKSGSVTITFTAEASGTKSIDSCQIAVDGVNWRTTDALDSTVINTEGYADGTHTILVRAFDSREQVGYSQPLALVIRNNPVAVSVAPGLADSVVRGTLAVAFTVDTVPPATVQSTQISVDGRAWRATSSNTTDTIDTDTLTEGSHTIQVRATDSRNRTGISKLVKFEVRNAPIVVLDSAASGNDELSGVDTIRFTVGYAPGASRDTTEIRFDGGAWIPTTGGLSHTWITTDFDDGNHTVQVRAVSSGADTGYSQVANFAIKNSPTATLYSPAAGESVIGTDTVVFTISPNLPGTITTREVSVDGDEWTSFDDTSFFELISHTVRADSSDSIALAIETSSWQDGSHSIRVRGTDSGDRTGYSREVLFVTSNGPKVVITQPAAGDTLSDSITVAFEATPVHPAKIVTMLLSLDGAAYDTITSDTVKLDSKGMADGSHLIKIKVVDSETRIGWSEELLVVVDNAPPIAAKPTVVYPGEGQSAKQGAEILVTALVHDVIAGDSSVVLTSENLDPAGPVSMTMVDDGSNGDQVAGDNVYTARLTVGAVTNGTIPYTITATDRLGNTTSLTSAIQLDNAKPSTWFRVEPLPQGTDSLTGHTYFQRLVLKGRYGDTGGSGLWRSYVSVHNDSAEHANSSPIVLPPEDTTSAGIAVSRVVELVPGLNVIRLVAVDNAGNADTTTARVTYYEPKATGVVTRADGGKVMSPDSTGVSVPPNAVLSPVEITVTRMPSVEQPKPLDPNMKLLNVARDFGPDGTVFRKPVTVTLTYTEADLDRDQNGEPDVDTSKLTIVFWNGDTWLPAGKPTRGPGKVSVLVNHFTMFDIAEDNTAQPGELLVYWTNNPVKSDTCAQLVFDLPEAGKVTAYIMDMAGDLVWQLIEKDTPYTASDNATWCGDNVAGRFAGAGLYVYVFKFTPNSGGEATIIRKPVGLLRQ